jgi:hypothetical protein
MTFYCKLRCDKLCAIFEHSKEAYRLHNFCSVCRKYFLKNNKRCPCCNVQLRTNRVNKKKWRIKNGIQV